MGDKPRELGPYFIAATVIAILALIVAAQTLSSRQHSIDWRPYRDGIPELLQSEGQISLVFAAAEWDPSAIQIERELENNLDLQRRLKSRINKFFICRYLDLDSVRANKLIADSKARWKEAFVILLGPKSGRHEAIYWSMDFAKKLSAALDEVQ